MVFKHQSLPVQPRLTGGPSIAGLLVRGFTLIELIMVIVILGVLAVFAAPRILNTNDFYARGFHDETLSYLRYAQKTAVAQRRTVCVTFLSTTALQLQIASAAIATNCSSVGILSGPKGDSGTSVTLNAKTGVAYSATPISFHFDGLGQPLDATTGAVLTEQTRLPSFSVSNLAPKSITVEVGTGYVHD